MPPGAMGNVVETGIIMERRWWSLLQNEERTRPSRYATLFGRSRNSKQTGRTLQLSSTLLLLLPFLVLSIIFPCAILANEAYMFSKIFK